MARSPLLALNVRPGAFRLQTVRRRHRGASSSGRYPYRALRQRALVAHLTNRLSRSGRKCAPSGKKRGLEIAKEQADIGSMETGWAREPCQTAPGHHPSPSASCLMVSIDRARYM